MPYWIRLITMTDVGVELMRKQPTEMLMRSRLIIEKMDARLLTAFATLGEFDVMSIIDARDEEHMAKIDKALESTGVYTARNIAALPVAEFLQTVAKTPIFLDSWLHGRTQARAQFAAANPGQSVTAAPTAASPKSDDRNKDINERRSLRTVAAEGKAYVIFQEAKPPVRGEVLNLAVAGEKDWAGICFVIGTEEGDRVGANGWEVGAELALTIELQGENKPIPAECKVARVDLISDDTYEIGIQYGELSRPLHARFQRFFQRLRRANK